MKLFRALPQHPFFSSRVRAPKGDLHTLAEPLIQNTIKFFVEMKVTERYGYHQRENTGSRLFTGVKPCWTGLISGWVTISIKYPVLYSLGSQAGVVDINHAIHLYYNVVCGSSFSRSQPDFEDFLRALRFSSYAKLTPSLIQYAGPH